MTFWHSLPLPSSNVTSSEPKGILKKGVSFGDGLNNVQENGIGPMDDDNDVSFRPNRVIILISLISQLLYTEQGINNWAEKLYIWIKWNFEVLTIQMLDECWVFTY